MTDSALLLLQAAADTTHPEWTGDPNFTTVPGTPIMPERSVRKCEAVASGAVSVVPQDDVRGMRSPVARTAAASSRSHRSWGNMAPA